MNLILSGKFHITQTSRHTPMEGYNTNGCANGCSHLCLFFICRKKFEGEVDEIHNNVIIRYVYSSYMTDCVSQICLMYAYAIVSIYKTVCDPIWMWHVLKFECMMKVFDYVWKV